MEKIIKSENASPKNEILNVPSLDATEIHKDHTKDQFPREKETLKSFSKGVFLLLFSIVLSLGVITGFLISRIQKGDPQLAVTGNSSRTKVETKDEAGVNDDKAFPDSSQGTLVKGGIDGEGTHYLDRGTGKTQYVYLTSTVINLDNFVGKKVEVKGQTLSARKAGWLMDVGKIKVVQ